MNTASNQDVLVGIITKTDFVKLFAKPLLTRHSRFLMKIYYTKLELVPWNL